jgi:hypothetical protein
VLRPPRRFARRPYAALAAAAALGMAGGLVALAGPAGARPAARTATPRVRIADHAAVHNGVETVELLLTPRDRTLLDATAVQAAVLTPRVRRDRLSTAIPGTARAAQVAAASRRLGLSVAATSAYAVTVTGSPARVLALFGSARAVDPQLATAQALPKLPAAYAGLVTVADGGDDTRPAELPHVQTGATATARAGSGVDGTLSVAQTRSLYGVTASYVPPTSSSDIVATLQLSTWSTEDADLASYARDNNLYTGTYNPAASTTNDELAITGCSVSGGGETEVALDQETLLTVAPQLRQRVYLAPNCDAAQDLALDDAASDAQGGLPIVAFSTSWGSCEEQAYADSGQAQADQDAVATATGAGITVFAAAGDDGSYDCLNNQNQEIDADAVDSPAVVPGVVGVGGTTLVSGTTVTAWDDDSTDATGGGFSCGFFPLPSYQDSVATQPTYPHDGFGCSTSSDTRQVPDIAADAGDGLDVVDTEQSNGSGRVYGTSFSAPLAAGGLAETLADMGATAGVGSISARLYGADCGGLSDVTTGGNGDYTAHAGYDEVTGLGTPIWPALLGVELRGGLPNQANRCLEQAIITHRLLSGHGF